MLILILMLLLTIVKVSKRNTNTIVYKDKFINTLVSSLVSFSPSNRNLNRNIYYRDEELIKIRC